MPILLSSIIGILIGYRQIPIWISIATISTAFAIYFLLRFFSRNPISTIRARSWHWWWVIQLFIGTGMLCANISYPPQFEHDFLYNQAYATAEVKSVETTTTGDRIIANVNSLISEDKKQSEIAGLTILLNSGATNIEIGDIIVFPLDISPITNSRNRQGFDYSDYMLNKGIRYKQYLHPTDIHIHSHRNSWHSVSHEIRDLLIILTEKSGLGKPTQNFIITMLFGDGSFMPDDTRQSFADTGIAHILALSGLHVGIIVMIINVLLFPIDFFASKKLKYFIIIVCIWAFAFITGLSASVVRASVMASFYFAAKIAEKQNNSINALCAAATAIILITPGALFNVGLQLSVVTVACIIVFSDRLNFIDRLHHPLLYSIVSTILVSIVAVAGSWILSAYYFHTFPLMFIPANTIVVPLLPIYISCVILYLLLLSFGIDPFILSLILNKGYELLTTFTSALSFQGSTLTNIWLSPITVIFYLASLGITAYWVAHRKRILLIAAAIGMAITILSSLVFPTDKPKDGFIVQNRWDRNLIRIYKNGCDTLYEIPRDTTSVISIYGRTIICIDNNIISRTERRRDKLSNSHFQRDSLSSPVNCDYLILCKGYRGSLEHVSRHYIASAIVLMPEIFYRKENSLLEEAMDKDMPIHSVRNSGPLSVFIEED